MVDTQSINPAALDQLEYFCVCCFEYIRPFDAECAQIIDIKKPAPIDVIRGCAPTGNAIMLSFQQLMQTFKTFRMTTVIIFKRCGNGWSQRGMPTEIAQFSAQPLCFFAGVPVFIEVCKLFNEISQSGRLNPA